MKKRLLQYLACPKCYGDLSLSSAAESGDDITDGLLRCGPCSLEFPIVRGIPRFLPSGLSSEKQATAAAFGYEWTHFTSLDQSYENEFLDWIKPVLPAFFKDKVVLDGGCGKGRHSFLSAKFGAKDVIGIDLSDAVEAAYQNTRHLPNVHIVQADIYNLPFRSPFDFIYSIGVLHHLPDPKSGFLGLIQHLKSRGQISIWVYGKEGNLWIEKLVNPVRIHVTSRMPKPITRAISFLLSIPLYLALKLIYGPVDRTPALSRLKKVLFYHDYLSEISRFSFAENYWNVFDHLVAPTAFYHSKQEMEDWCKTAGLDHVLITQRTGNSWRASGQKN